MANKSSPGFNVAIVGAGFGGLSVAIALKTKWGFDDFVIYERGADIGGTWRDNDFPGCASDVNIHFYSLSTDLQSDWKYCHGTQPEILRYMHKITDKYGLRRHCRFHTSMDKAEWDVDKNMWRIETRDVRTGEMQVTHATALIPAIGVLLVPKLPKLQGIESFKGALFHSARWRHDVDLHGTVLAFWVTEVLLYPGHIQEPEINVVNFARTKMWFVPAPTVPYRETTKWIFEHVPFVQRVYRFVIAASYEMLFLVFRGKGDTRSLTFFSLRLQLSFIGLRMKAAPPQYHHLIIPTYLAALGCRRVVRDQGYLESLSRPNVRLTFDNITRIEPDGILMETGEKVHLDVIICATGFVTDEYSLDVRGTRGTLKEYNNAHGGPTAYLGTTVPGFPNFFMMQGTLASLDAFFLSMTHPAQIPYILQLLAPVRSGVLTTVVPTDAATDKYNDMLQKRLGNSVWTQCASCTFPGPLVLLWWWLRKPRWTTLRSKVQRGAVASSWVACT
ncbi:FAD/NAD-P-binding domain-containing protein [Lactarius quietus]|nr:FAD/NAD-P-binding domain-containing protein [Lactarius quietus]